MAGGMAGWKAGWLAGKLAGWLAGWLDGWMDGWIFFVLCLYFTSNIDKYCQILADIVQTVMGLRLVAGIYSVWALCTIEIQFNFSLVIAPP